MVMLVAVMMVVKVRVLLLVSQCRRMCMVGVMVGSAVL